MSDPGRNPRFPDVPSLDESYPGLAYESLLGLFGPARMPTETVQQLHADLRTALRDPVVREQLDRQSIAVIASTPAEFAAVLRREIEHWRGAVRESGARLN